MIKSINWTDEVPILKWKFALWKVVLFVLLLLGLGLTITYSINSVLAYLHNAQNIRLNKELADSNEKLLKLQKLEGETLGQLTAAKIEAAAEKQQRESAEKIFMGSDITSDEKVRRYEEAKRTIVIDNYDYTTEQLCERALEFGIKCEKPGAAAIPPAQ